MLREARGGSVTTCVGLCLGPACCITLTRGVRCCAMLSFTSFSVSGPFFGSCYNRQGRKAKNRGSRDSYSNRADTRTQTVRNTGTHNLPLHLMRATIRTNDLSTNEGMWEAHGGGGPWVLWDLESVESSILNSGLKLR